MSALRYVLIHDAKNKLLELRRKPVKLIMYLLVIAFLVWVIVISIIQPEQEDNLTDIMWLKAVGMALFLFTVLISIKQGFAKGTTLFNMEDVNMLFVSPVSPQSILLYGVVRMMKTVVLSTIFILFNSGTLRSFFGVGFGGVLIVFAAFVLVSAVSQLLTLVIYSVTNSRPRRQSIAKLIIALSFAPLVIGAIWYIMAESMNLTAALLSLMNSPLSSLSPVAGWAAAGMLGFVMGNYAAGALFFGLLVAAGAILVAIIYIGNPDYYEDVLVATETAFEKARGIADGNIDAASVVDKKVKIKATGIGGFGASAVFHRHIREAFRMNRVGLWSTSTVVLVLYSIGYGILMNNVAYGGGEHLFSLIIMLMVAQIFMAGTGRGVKDTYNHYIYMIPESPLKKMLWSNLEVLFKVAVQNTLILVAGGIVMGSQVHVIVTGIIVCTLFSFVILGVSFLSMRFTGAHMSMGILSMVYIVAIIIIMLPGLVGAVAVGFLAGEGGLIAGLLVLALWEVIAGFGCFAASKGVLHNCDMPSMSTMSKK